MRTEYLNYDVINEIFHVIHDSITSYSLYDLMIETMNACGKDITNFVEITEEKVKLINRSDNPIMSGVRVVWNGN